MSENDKSFGQLLLEGAREALAVKRGELEDVRTTRRKVTARKVDVLPPPSYGQKEVKRLRRRLGVSQAVFADLLSVSRASVRAWERGVRTPSSTVCRLMEIVERRPEVLSESLREPVEANT